MDFSFERLRPNERVVWSGELEKRQRDAATKPAPPISGAIDGLTPLPSILGVKNGCHFSGANRTGNVPEKNISRIHEHGMDERIVRALRGQWGIET